MTQKDIERVTGIPAGTYSTYERGVRDVNSDIIVKLAKCFGTTTDYLYGIENVSDNELSQKEIENIKKYRKLDDYGTKAVDDLLNNEYERCINTDEQEKQPTITISYSRLPASAGAGYFLQEENLEEREFPDTPISRQADVVIPVDGDSMEPMFYDGDELYVRLQPAVNVGEIGIFLKGENAFVKKYAEDRLISLNPSYDDIYPSESEDEQIVCRGKVLGKVE